MTNARKTCATCGAGIWARKIYCAPCSDVRREQSHSAIVRRRRCKAKELLAIQPGAVRDTAAPFTSALEAAGGADGADAVVLGEGR
jgi:hypothetical protein